MIDIFSRKGMQALKRWPVEQSLLAFDYDGTLVPIVRDPLGAILTKKTRKVLKDLSKKYPVAIITGRSLKEIRQLTHDLHVILIGNHGLESPVDSKQKLKKAATSVRKWIPTLKILKLDLPGLYVENKIYSISLHYRETNDHDKAEKQILAATKQIKPKPRIVLGKKIINLVPAGSPDKGKALVALLRKNKIKSAVFVGDDVTDEDVFRLKNKNIFKIRVGPSKKTKAKYLLKDQKMMDSLLRDLARS